MSVWRIRSRVGVMWEKLRWNLWEMDWGSASGVPVSSLEKERAI